MKSEPLTDSELNRINKALISRDHKRCFAIARYTGEPFGRIVKLKIGDVYSDELFPLEDITISASGNSFRQIFVTPILQGVLIRYRPKYFNPDSWLFPSRIKKGEHITVSNVDKWFRSALYVAELDGRSISPSDIRRAFIFKLHGLGFSDQNIKEVVGLKALRHYRKNLDCQSVDKRGILQRIFD